MNEVLVVPVYVNRFLAQNNAPEEGNPRVVSTVKVADPAEAVDESLVTGTPICL